MTNELRGFTICEMEQGYVDMGTLNSKISEITSDYVKLNELKVKTNEFVKNFKSTLHYELGYKIEFINDIPVNFQQFRLSDYVTGDELMVTDVIYQSINHKILEFLNTYNLRDKLLHIDNDVSYNDLLNLYEIKINLYITEGIER